MQAMRTCPVSCVVHRSPAIFRGQAKLCLCTCPWHRENRPAADRPKSIPALLAQLGTTRQEGSCLRAIAEKNGRQPQVI